MDHHHHYHHQYHNQMVISNNPFINNTTICSSTPPPPPPTRATPVLDQKKMTRPREHLNCPRCNSTNTKFCYYNNYSLTQPRYLCKTCRRYWTEGGSLRNVPVGGGSRKNRKLPSTTSPSSSSSSSSSTKINLPDLNPPFLFSSTHHLNPNNIYGKPHKDHHDLSLSFSHPMHNSQAQGHICNVSHHLKTNIISPSTGVSGQNFNFMTALESNPAYNNNNNNNSLSGLINFHHQYDNKASLGFSLDGQQEAISHHDVVNGGSRVLFPFGDIKQLIPTTTTHNQVHHEDHHHHHQEQHNVVNKRSQGNAPSNELWNGIVLGGGRTW